VTAKNELKITAGGGGDINASGSSITSTDNKINLETEGSGNKINITSATIRFKDSASADTNSEGTLEYDDGCVEEENGNSGTYNDGELSYTGTIDTSESLQCGSLSGP